MTKKLQLDLPDEVYDALARLAQGSGQSPEWIVSAATNIAGVSSRSSHASPSTSRRSASAHSSPAPEQKQHDPAGRRSSSRPKSALVRGEPGELKELILSTS